MSTPVLRGWCPGAHRPMASGDGLVVRIRPPLGELTPDQARGLADLADRFGTGPLALTNRANVQIRGVKAGAHGALMDGLAVLGLLDRDGDAEGRRTIVFNPLRPLGPTDPQTQVAARLCEALADSDLDNLPSKFGFVVDAGRVRYLTAVSGDIRLEAADNTLIVRADGWARGRSVQTAAEAAALALDLARWFLASGGAGAEGRGRMARHLAAGARLPRSFQGRLSPNTPACLAKPGVVAGGVLVAAPFGELATDDLRRLADSAAPVLRITPWRMVFLPGVSELGWLRGATDLITASEDPLLRVVACTGAPGCPQASVETRALARFLAPGVAAGSRLHISGCAKGCAHPAMADVTLVGHDGRFDLVKRGAAWDQADHRGLEPTALNDLIRG